jgi:hypothetical protein
MKGSIILKRVQHTLVKNSPSLLTAVAISGVVSTAYLAAKAGWRSNEIIRENKANLVIANRKDRYKEYTKLVWKEYIPAAATGTVTIAAIVGSNRVGAKRGAAAQAALVLSERAYSEYRDKIVEEFGERKDRSIRDEIAEKHVHENPPSPMIVSGPGNVLCYEDLSGRYFTSDMETLRRTTNALNEKLLKHDRMSLSDWYDMLGLRHTTYSDEMGWWSDKLLEITYGTFLAEDNRPCISITYNYTKPIYGG